MSDLWAYGFCPNYHSSQLKMGDKLPPLVIAKKIKKFPHFTPFIAQLAAVRCLTWPHSPWGASNTPAARKLTISRYECHNQSHQKDQLEHCFACSNITISYVVAVSHDSDNKFVDNSYIVQLCEWCIVHGSQSSFEFISVNLIIVTRYKKSLNRQSILTRAQFI